MLEQDKARLEEELSLTQSKYKTLDIRMTDLHHKLKNIADKKADISTQLEIAEEQLYSKVRVYLKTVLIGYK